MVTSPPPLKSQRLDPKFLFPAMRGVTVSSSAFLTCHQSYCEGSSLAWRLNFQLQCVSFSEARRQGFSPGTPVSSPTSSVNDSANNIKLK